MRHSEPRSGFVPDNKPAEGEWYWIDAPGIAQSLQLPPDTPLVEVGGCCCCWLTALWSAAMVLDTVFIEGKPHIQEQYRASSCHLSLHNLLAAALFRPLSTPHIWLPVVCRSLAPAVHMKLCPQQWMCWLCEPRSPSQNRSSIPRLEECRT